LTSPVNTLGKDEVGILARTFDDMRGKLQASYSNLQQKTKELSSLLSVSEILNSTLDLSSLLDAVTTKAVGVTPNADGGVLLTESSDHHSLIVQCAIGLDKKALSRFIPDHKGELTGGQAPELERAEQRKELRKQSRLYFSQRSCVMI
jgi:nitrate/nitrite-specific signal transduction histidine kinase